MIPKSVEENGKQQLKKANDAIAQKLGDERQKKAIRANWICLKCCWFDGKERCLSSTDHNGDEGNCWGVCGCADFAQIEEDGCFTTWMDA